MAPHVLVAPACARFSPEAASESGWIYDIVTGVATRCPDFRFTCLVAESAPELPMQIRVAALGSWRADALGGLALPWRISAAARPALRAGEFDLVHHGLPFAAGRSFSIVGTQAVRRGIPLVLGPVQTPLEWTGADEHGGTLNGQCASRLRTGALALAQRLYPLVAPGLSSLSLQTMRRASRIVAISPAARRLLIEAGVDPGRVEVVPPPVRMAQIGVAAWPRPAPALRLLTAGYLIERKGVVGMAKIVSTMAARGVPVVLDIAGDGPAAAMVKTAADQFGGGNAVHVHGWLGRQQLSDLYSSAHVYVSMSKAESWGHAVADALAAGLVAVSADNVGARAMVELGAPLRLVPVDGWVQLGQVLLELAKTDVARLRLEGSAGVGWAAETLGLPVIADRWSKVYREALAATGQRSRVRSLP